jgi:hypothetical protein
MGPRFKVAGELFVITSEWWNNRNFYLETDISVLKWLSLRAGINFYQTTYLGSGSYTTSYNNKKAGIGIKIRRLLLSYFTIMDSNNKPYSNNIRATLKFGAPQPGQPVEEQKTIAPEPQTQEQPAIRKQKATPAEQIRQAKEAVEPVVQLQPKKMSDRMNIAVAEFSGRNVSSMEAAIVSDFLRGELVKTEQFNMLDRQNMETLLNEQKFSNVSGCTTEECAVQMGKLLNVKKIITGSLSKLLDKYYITINILDVESGKIEAADKDSATTADEISTACERIGQRVGAKYK